MDSKAKRVVAAVIMRDGKYLCMQRCRKGRDYIAEHWEFPGGKVEAGETDHEALIREIKEEMDWDVYVGRKLGTVEEQYPDFSISLTAYLCKGGNGEFKLLEHLDYKWLTKDELPRLNWTDADRKLLALL
ncbi:MAG: (deoxy)nucleoside triphosphate pyrophosphohydrolase [Prevotella sp.]|nr:(deoxy)nucleoside triphosphate pyrophosphohydrolase [Prevotella sp.]